MLYFKDFNTLLYKFGNEDDPVIFQDIARYADVIDQVKDNISFLTFHTIQEGFRADQVSANRKFENIFKHIQLYRFTE